MSSTAGSGVPPSIERVLKVFRSMGREEKMQALIQYSQMVHEGSEGWVRLNPDDDETVYPLRLDMLP